MGYAQYLATNELFWASVFGAAVGVALAAVTRRASLAARPARSRTRNRAAAILALAVAFASAACGLVFPPELAIVGMESLYAAVAALVVIGAATRFPRSVGISVLLLSGAIAVILRTSVAGWTPVRSPRTLAEIAIVSMTPDSLTLGVAVGGDDGAEQQLVSQEGPELRVTADEVVFSPYMFFLGAQRFVRYTGPGAPVDSTWPSLLPRAVFATGRAVASVPGVNLLQRYRVMATNVPGALALARIR